MSAKDNDLKERLDNIRPGGSTAMRDSIKYGINMMLELYNILKKLEMHE